MGAIRIGLMWRALLFAFLLSGGPWVPASAEPVARAVEGRVDFPVTRARRDGLVAIPSLSAAWARESSDESIAAAVALGNDPLLERRSKFRKRSIDIFQTEREVVIGNAEMLLRLRLRPKSRETMSVELHF